MNIGKETEEINKKNHKWWHFFWKRIKKNDYELLSGRMIEQTFEYCERPECGWEKVKRVVKEPEL